MGLDPEHHFETHNFLELAAFFTCIWTGSLWMFLEHRRFNMTAYVSPLALLVFYGAFLLNPFKMCWYGGRMWFIQHMVIT